MGHFFSLKNSKFFSGLKKNWPIVAPITTGGSVVVDSLLIVDPIVGFYVCSVFCCALLCVLF